MSTFKMMPSLAQSTVLLTSPSATGFSAIRKIRTDIEALRAIAILLVVAFHCHLAGIPGGFVGVDVFYVLSGYLISGLLVAESEKTSGLNFLRFYAKRIRRLLPAAALVLLTTLIAGVLVFSPRELNLTAQAARADAVYLSNLYFSASASDYFSARVTFNPLLNTWSLAVEEQFYLFWPLLISAGLLIWRSRAALLALMALLTLVSIGANLWLTDHERVLAFYALPTRAWEFGIGGLAALIPRGALHFGRAGWLALGWLGVMLVMGSALAFSSALPFPGWRALFPVIGTAITLVAGTEAPLLGVGVLFNTAPLQTLGRLSYSWYLWHWPFLVFTAAIYPAGGDFERICAAAASLCVAYATFRYVEDPIRRHPVLIGSPKLTLGIGCALTAVSLVTAELALRYANDLDRTPQMQSLDATRADFADLSRGECVSVKGSAAVKICTFAAAGSGTKVVLFGDSHAAQWFDSLDQIAQREHWQLTTVIKLGCAAVAVNPSTGIDQDPECIAWRQQAIQDIVALRPTLILLGSATNKLDRPENPDAQADAALVAKVREGVLRTLRLLSASGARMVLLRDTPEFPFDVTACLARTELHSWYPGDACDLPAASVLEPQIFAAERAAAANLPGVRLIDLTTGLCPNGMCRAVVDGAVMYRDSHHLAGRSAEILEPRLEAQLTAALR